MIINGVYPNHSSLSGIFGSIAENQKQYVQELRRLFPDTVSEVPLQQSEVKGVKNISYWAKLHSTKKKLLFM